MIMALMPSRGNRLAGPASVLQRQISTLPVFLRTINTPQDSNEESLRSMMQGSPESKKTPPFLTTLALLSTGNSQESLPPIQENKPKPTIEFKKLSIRNRIHLYTDMELWQIIRQPSYQLPNHPDYHFLKSRLWDRYSKDVWSVVRSYCSKRLPKNAIVQPADIFQSVALRLWKAMDEYDLKIGITFMQYCNAPGRSILYGSIIDELRTLQDYPRVIAKYRRSLKPIIEALTHVLHRTPTTDELCDYGNREFGADFEREHRPILEDKLFASGVFNQRGETGPSDDNDTDAGEMHGIIHSTSAGFEDFNTDVAAREIDRVTARMQVLDSIPNSKIRDVIWYYYWMKLLHSRIAYLMGLSPASVANLHKQGLTILHANYTFDEMNELLR